MPELTLPSLCLSFALALGLAGCDTEDPADPAERTARVLVEVDGTQVEQTDISEDPQLAAELVLEAEESEATTCYDDEVELGFVLEVDGEPAAAWSECADGSTHGIDSLAAEPDAQAEIPACSECAATNDCFACCRCWGGSVFECWYTC